MNCPNAFIILRLIASYNILRLWVLLVGLLFQGLGSIYELHSSIWNYKLDISNGKAFLRIY